jgi:hypothetical protein
MSTPEIAHLLRGPFTFLRPVDEEIFRLVPDARRILPMPQRIHGELESATPTVGFPILATPDLDALAVALEEFLLAEEDMQVAVLRRQPFDQKTFNARWERYRGLLARALENSSLSSYGRLFTGIFWLFHSRQISRLLKNTPKRIARIDSALGREHGDSLKYKVFHRFLDRVLGLSYDLAHRLATDTDELEEEIFPPLLTAMRDNVLIFTEDYVSPDLGELSSYFSGYLRLDSRDFRSRLEAVASWHAQRLASDPELRAMVRHVVGQAPETSGRELLFRPGWVSYLASRADYDPRSALAPDQVQVWESLLLKLKEFELLLGLRRQMVVLAREGNDLVLRERDLDRTMAGQRQPRVSAMTRPLDFMAPWVVDPQVSRCGMIYDITDFTELISVHRRSALDVQDRAFRQMFSFQRKVNRVALGKRLNLEKYLGDGAFYSAREATGMVVVAIAIQRLYRSALREGFAFDRGLRIALNFGHYRLIPFQGSHGNHERYEFFGHGVIELSRLVTGKATREIEEIKNMLVNRGYPEPTVDRFFAPLTRKNLDVIDKAEENREFYAYVNANGTLVNEGVVATGPFLERLQRDAGLDRYRRCRDGDRQYVVVSIPDQPQPLEVGLRPLGLANLKGLGRVPAYEVVDVADLPTQPTGEVTATPNLLAAIDRLAIAGTHAAERP